MKLIKSFFIFLLTLGIMTAYAAEKDSASKSIKVLLQKNNTEALLEVKGGYNIFDPKDGTKISSAFTGKRYIVRTTNTGIKWGEEFLGIHQLYIVPKEKDG